MPKHLSRKSHIHFIVYSLCLFVLFASGSSYGSCKSAAKLSADIWKNWRGIANVVGCAVGTSVAGAPQKTPSCIRSANKYQKMVNGTVKGWNKIGGQGWARIGPRALSMNTVHKGTLVSLGTRMFISPGPSNKGSITIRIKETKGRSKTRVHICSTGLERDVRQHKDFFFNQNKSLKSRIGQSHTINIKGVRNRVVSVLLASKDPGKKFAYTVKMTASVVKKNANLKTRKAPIWVVSLGDSYSSGEGNPHNGKLISLSKQPQAAAGAIVAHWKSEGTAINSSQPKVLKWLSSYKGIKRKLERLKPRVKWRDERCHRSKYGWPYLVAASLTEKFPKQKVQFDYLACSGASIKNGLLGTFDNKPKRYAKPLEPQLDVLARLIQEKKGRRPDIILMTAGGNDIGFSDVVLDCLILGCAKPGHRLNRLIIDPSEIRKKINSLKGLYGEMHKKFTKMKIPSSRIFVLQYPDVLRNYKEEIQAGCWHLTNDKSFRWAYKNVYVPMNNQLKAAAAVHRWNLTTAVGRQSEMANFRKHGYCVSNVIRPKFKRWVRRLIPSLQRQLDPFGTFHPNSLGNAAMASAVQAKVDRKVRSLIKR